MVAQSLDKSGLGGCFPRAPRIINLDRIADREKAPASISSAFLLNPLAFRFNITKPWLASG